MSILKQYLLEKNSSVEVPEEFMQMIAKNIDKNVRELEGSLTKVLSLIKLGMNPTEEDIAKLLQIDLESKRKKITPMKVIKAVSDVFDVKISEIKGDRRTAYIAKCRQIVMYILRNELSMPLERVAKEVNRNYHTTVLHACEKIDLLKKKDPKFNERLNECYKIIRD